MERQPPGWPQSATLIPNLHIDSSMCISYVYKLRFIAIANVGRPGGRRSLHVHVL